MGFERGNVITYKGRLAGGRREDFMQGLKKLIRLRTMFLVIAAVLIFPTMAAAYHYSGNSTPTYENTYFWARDQWSGQAHTYRWVTPFYRWSGDTLFGWMPVPGEEAPSPAPQPAPEAPVVEPPAPAPQPPAPAPKTPATSQPVSGLTAEENRMLSLVNQARTSQGLAPLAVDLRLVDLARKKSRDMIANNYFGHNSPTYGSPFDMMRSAGVTYRYAGENLAGTASVERAHELLMNSEGHRRNILNPNFDHVGIGIADGGPYGKMFTQMFIGN